MGKRKCSRMWVRLRHPKVQLRGYTAEDGPVLEVETQHLFDDQFNVIDPHGVMAEYQYASYLGFGGSSGSKRVFDYQIVEVINDARRGKGKSSWSGKIGPVSGPDAKMLEVEAYYEWRDSTYRRVGDLEPKIVPFPKYVSPALPSMGKWRSGKVVKAFKNGRLDLSWGGKIRSIRTGTIANWSTRHLAGAYPSIQPEDLVGRKVFFDPDGIAYISFSLTRTVREETTTLPYVIAILPTSARAFSVYVLGYMWHDTFEWLAAKPVAQVLECRRRLFTWLRQTGASDRIRHFRPEPQLSRLWGWHSGGKS